MQNISERVVDVRELPAPEPFQKVMQALACLPESTLLRMIHRKTPLPLFKVLLENQWAYRVLSPHEGLCEVLIWRVDDQACAAYAHNATSIILSSAP